MSKVKVEVVSKKRFVISKKMFGQGKVIHVTFKDGKERKYDHDKVIELNKEKLAAMNCWAKYSTYTSSNNLPSWAEAAEIK